MSRMSFELLKTDGIPRRGRLTFPRGTIETPAFMPVGTYGSVKGILPEHIKELGAEIILGNTFHLYLRPGLEVIGKRLFAQDVKSGVKRFISDFIMHRRRSDIKYEVGL